MHNADGTFTERADQAQYEELHEMLNLQRHLIKLNGVWNLPKIPTDSAGMKALGLIVNDWQLAGIFTGSSGSRYDPTFNYNSAGGAVNLTGSPDYGNNGTGARVVMLSDTDDGCSGDQYKQFDTSIVKGPTYNSVGLESGRNQLIGCPTYRTDLSIARNIPFGKGGRQVQIRLDAYNAFNQAHITGRQNQMTFNNPTDQVIQNSQFLPDGTVDPNRLKPNQAGFGAANAWSTNLINGNYQRVIQITARIQFLRTRRRTFEKRVGDSPTRFFCFSLVPCRFRSCSFRSPVASAFRRKASKLTP